MVDLLSHYAQEFLNSLKSCIFLTFLNFYQEKISVTDVNTGMETFFKDKEMYFGNYKTWE